MRTRLAACARHWGVAMTSAGKAASVGKQVRQKGFSDQAPRAVGKNVELICERSAPDRRGVDLAKSDIDGPSAIDILGSEFCRDDLAGFPELSEPDVMRHFLRLSQLNFAQALQFYPLGSCTMKYNPVVNDELASLAGL